MFAKGQEVYSINAAYDRKGLVHVCKYTVVSCGKKRGTLQRVEDGKMMSSFFYVESYGDKGGRRLDKGSFDGLYAVNAHEAVRIAMELGREFLVYERERLQECLDDLPNHHYNKFINEQIVALRAAPVVMCS